MMNQCMQSNLLSLLTWSSVAICLLTSTTAISQTPVEYLGAGESGAILLLCKPALPVFSPAISGSVKVELEEGTPLLIKAAPDIPRLSTAIIVDDEKKMEVVISRAEFVEYPLTDIVPSKGNLLRTIDPDSLPYVYGPVYQLNEFFPGKLADLDPAFIQGQFRGQSLHFYPVQYNPVTHVVRFYTEIEIAVVPVDEIGFNSLPPNVPDRTNLIMQEVYRDRFINYAGHGDRYDQLGELGDMLVIAHAQYLEELEPWVQWKKEKGIQVEVVDIATVNSVAAIKNLIADRYASGGLTYVVLVGDEDQVPVELTSNSSGVGYCDACYGYLSGDDHYSEVLVGHLLVHTDSELVPVIQKILEYEKSPYMASDWFSVAMGIGSSQGNGVGDDNESDWQHQNLIKTDLLGFTYTSVFERYDGNHQADSPTGGVTADGTGNPNAGSLSGIINDGCSLINYTGHGDHNLIVTGGYSNANINQLTNHGKYPYFIIVGCCVGDYDDDAGSGDTFGEAWLKTDEPGNPTGGIGGAFSTVFQSWAPPMEGQDEMNQLISESGTYATRHTLGSIHFHGCGSMNDAYGEEGFDMTDTWTLMADPSLQLRTAFPAMIEASHVPTANFGVNHLTVSSSTEDALVCVSFQGEIRSTGLIQNGICELSFPGVSGPGSLLVTLTSFNTIPYQGYVQLLPAEGPYVVNTSYQVDDSNGNGNGLADYTEDLFLDVVLENIGIEMAGEVVVGLSTDDDYVSITEGVYSAGDISIGQTIEADNAFRFVVAEDIPDQHLVSFIITMTDAEQHTWTSPAHVTLHAPHLVCAGTPVISDSGGNNNGRPDSGETISVTFYLMNDGHAAAITEIACSLQESSDYASVPVDEVSAGIINPGEMTEVSFAVMIGNDVPVSSDLFFTLTAGSGFYTTQCDLEETINEIVEDWEAGEPGDFNWSYSGDVDWFITGNNPYQGNNCVQSGDIGNNESSSLALELEVEQAGEISFAVKVSCENAYDFLRFRVDGVTVESWTGEVNWTEYAYSLTPGVHTLRWIYEKDLIYSSGADAAWLDEIIMPSGSSVSVIESDLPAEEVFLYPNPSNGQVNLHLPATEDEEIRLIIEDMGGRIVLSERLTPQDVASHIIPIDGSGWSEGMYFVRIMANGRSTCLRLVRQ
jgi:gingipain R